VIDGLPEGTEVLFRLSANPSSAGDASLRSVELSGLVATLAGHLLLSSRRCWSRCWSRSSTQLLANSVDQRLDVHAEPDGLAVDLVEVGPSHLDESLSQSRIVLLGARHEILVGAEQGDTGLQGRQDWLCILHERGGARVYLPSNDVLDSSLPSLCLLEGLEDNRSLSLDCRDGVPNKLEGMCSDALQDLWSKSIVDVLQSLLPESLLASL